MTSARVMLCQTAYLFEYCFPLCALELVHHILIFDYKALTAAVALQTAAHFSILRTSECLR
jgi:hypothetical protein